VTTPRSMAIIGFGEVGQTFARQFHAAGLADIRLFDVLFVDPKSGPSLAVAGSSKRCASAPEAVAGAEIVVSAVTAGSDLDAARSVLPKLAPRTWFWDLNSVSPGTKRAAAAIIESAGGRYVESAVMSSIPPKGIRSPMLLGGPHARDFIAGMAPFDLDMTFYSDEIGRASAVKMCRSVLIKGLEALLTESMLAARHYGVEADVLASLADTIPHPDWPRQAAYMISRALLHGRRRAEEMREVAKTVQEAGVAPLLSVPTAERQDWAASEGARIAKHLLKAPELKRLLDELTAKS
jgi:3-hydroxyisobutyrate dehydrogenase-like beta-hydroxyacid dehydrogenase